MDAPKQLRAAGGAILNFDNDAREMFQPHSDTLPVEVLNVLSRIGDQPQLRAISGALILFGTFANSDRMVRAGARMMIAHEAATFAKNLVKANIDRTRPRSADGGKKNKPKKGEHTAKERTSFPSGHSAGAIAAARAFSREFPEYGAAALGAATFVALSQIPRCAHYPTDVAAGLAVGLASEALVNGAWSAASMDDRSED